MRALRAAVVGVARHSTSSREVSRSKRLCRRVGLQNRDTPLGCLHGGKNNTCSHDEIVDVMLTL